MEFVSFPSDALWLEDISQLQADGWFAIKLELAILRYGAILGRPFKVFTMAS